MIFCAGVQHPHETLPIHALGSELVLGNDDGSGVEVLTGGIERDRVVVGRKPEAAILGPY
jgi:hypothetical protein